MDRSPSMTRKPRSYMDRKVETRDKIPRMLIVCEGSKTEPNYFRSFRVSKVLDLDVKGLGENTLSLVERAIELKAGKAYDQVWCVFDKDSFPNDNFDNAINRAESQGIKVAYSNEAFEIWYLLHFNYHNTPIPRNEYCHRLSDLLGRKYEKNDLCMYGQLLGFQGRAIQNAHKLLSTCYERSKAKNNPSTTVHLLVIELNKYTADSRK